MPLTSQDSETASVSRHTEQGRHAKRGTISTTCNTPLQYPKWHGKREEKEGGTDKEKVEIDREEGASPRALFGVQSRSATWRQRPRQRE